MLAVCLLTPSGVGAAADPLAAARDLHDQARDFERAGDFRAAGEAFAAAHQSLPEPCSPLGLSLLLDAATNLRRAYQSTLSHDDLCRAEVLLTGASPQCPARVDLVKATRQIRKQIQHDGVRCLPAVPASRAVDDTIPTAVVVEERSPPTSVQAPPPPASTFPAPRAPDRQFGARRPLLLAGGALVGLGAGVAAVFVAGAAVGASTREQVEGLSRAGVDGCAAEGPRFGECLRLDRRGLAMNRLAIASGAAAAALVVTGVVLLIAGRPRATRRLALAADGLTWSF